MCMSRVTVSQRRKAAAEDRFKRLRRSSVWLPLSLPLLPVLTLLLACLSVASVPILPEEPAFTSAKQLIFLLLTLAGKGADQKLDSFLQ